MRHNLFMLAQVYRNFFEPNVEVVIRSDGERTDYIVKLIHNPEGRFFVGYVAYHDTETWDMEDYHPNTLVPTPLPNNLAFHPHYS